jgi:phosphohistidine phosphatase
VRLLIIRHAIAVARGTPGIPDDERPLTPEGRRRFRAAAMGLARIAPRPDAILTSPLPRARQTAEMAAKAWGGPAPRDETAMIQGSLEELSSVLSDHPTDATIALVGHEPHLSWLLAMLIGAEDGDRLTFKKGGAACVDLPASLGEGGRLRWFLPPKVLRSLAKS